MVCQYIDAVILNLVYLNRNRYLAIDRFGGELLKISGDGLSRLDRIRPRRQEISILNAFSGGIGEGIFYEFG